MGGGPARAPGAARSSRRIIRGLGAVSAYRSAVTYEPSEDEQRALDWLRALPENAEIGWSTHHLGAEAPFSCGWIDVEIPELGKAVGWNWCFTIEALEFDMPEHIPAEHQALYDRLPDPRGDGIFEPRVAFDATLEVKTDDEGNAIAARLRPDDGAPLDLSDQIAENPDAWAGYAIYREPRLIDGEPWYCQRVWTPLAVSLALENFCREHVGRSDIRFRWDSEAPVSERMAHVFERAAAYRRGELETYSLGDGVEATEEGMDFLLALGPGGAADASEQLKQLTRGLRADDE